MAFKYQRRDASAIDKRANQKSNDFEGFILADFPVWTPKKGDNWIRILPPTWEDAAHYGLDVWVHYRVGADDATVLCTQKMPDPKTGKFHACRVCDAAKEADRRGDEDLVKEMLPRKRVAVWMVDMKEEDKGPQIWPMSWTVDRDIAKVSKDRRSGEIYTIDHPDDGYDIYFDREGDGIKTKYTGVQLAKRPSSVPDKWLDFVEEHPLPDTLEWRSPDEVAALFGDDDAPRRRRDDDDDRRPSRRRDDDERTSRRRDDDERTSRRRDDDERTSRRRDDDERTSRRRDDDDKDERPRRERSRDDEDDKDERPRRAPTRDVDPPRRRRDADEEEKPRARRDADADPPFDTEKTDPPRKRRVAIEPDKDEPEEKPRARRDADEEDEKPRKRRDDDEEESRAEAGGERRRDDDDRRGSGGAARAEALRAKFKRD